MVDDENRVRIGDGSSEQSVCVRRGGWHDDGQPRNVGEQSFQALRVLGTRRTPGAELGADYEGHLGVSASHEPELRGLIHNLVEADTDEVEVHDLDDRLGAGHGATDGQPHDCRLGDRRVEHAPRESISESTSETEHVSGSDVDAGKPNRGIALHLVGERGQHFEVGPHRRRGHWSRTGWTGAG